MIRYQEMVPDYYVEQSRDFQVLCRLYDFTLNSLKYNIDSIQNITDTRNIKDTLLPLLGDKLGIYDKEAYSNRQLLEALPIALKYKGSLKSIKILLNAFLDSLNIFDEVIAVHTTNESSAEEISEILNRKIDTYSIVVIMSTFLSLTDLHVLNEYLNMVMPSGMKIEFTFGVQKEYFDKLKYKEYTFLFYTHEHEYDFEEGKFMIPYISMLREREDRYKAEVIDRVFDIQSDEKTEKFIKTVTEGKAEDVPYSIDAQIGSIGSSTIMSADQFIEVEDE